MSGMDRLTDEALERIVAGGAWATEGEAVLMARELLAQRRASQAAPTPSDGLREAADRVAYEMWMQLETAGYGEAAGYMQTAWMGERILAALSASPAQEGGRT